MIEKLVEKETCVLCDSSTDYDINCDINERKCYVEGAGQLCELCFAKIY